MVSRSFAALAGSIFLFTTAQAAEDGGKIETGSVVSFNYSLSLEDGTFVESNRDAEPMTYVQGEGRLIPGVEEAMLGHEAGDEFSITVQPKDAYGQVDPARRQDVPIDMIPEAARVEGATVTAASFPGVVTVHSVGEETVTLDFNHPLAGEVLEFDISVVGVEPPAESPAEPAAPAAN